MSAPAATPRYQAMAMSPDPRTNFAMREFPSNPLGQDTRRSRLAHPFTGIVLILMSAQLLVSSSVPTVREPLLQAAFDPYQYIPKGAKIPNQKKDIVFADLDGDGQDEVVLFYLVPHGRFVVPSIKVLKREGSVWADIWRTSADVGWDFVPPSGVYDLLKNGRPQIVSYISVGASCWGSLDVYQYDPLTGSIRSLNGWPEHGCVDHLRIKGLDGDSVPEIIFTATNYSTIPHIYWWSGESFILSNTNFPDYYSKELKRLVADATEKNSPAREMWGGMAVQIYMLQHRYREAISFCRRLLALTEGQVAAQQVLKSSEWTCFQTSKVSSNYAFQAVIRGWLGDAYRDLNNLAKARSENQMAVSLDLAAKRLDPNHMVPFLR